VASMRVQNSLLFGFCMVPIGVLGVDVLLQFAANILGWRKGHVAHMCGLSAGNYSRSGVGLASSAD